ncbi:MAG TPA: heterodisulfide reductase-related iron-sulfur binding cluster [Polyangiaceae bacterium]|nr:heterodisulfide reductase-related iron-sulfur binding cluster [Polyangiaceae bacterium]
MSHIPRRPAEPPAWAPENARYWNERDLEREILRTFQVCHECRMCVTYCGSFPLLFDAVDREIESGRAEGAETLGPDTIRAVSDHCFQCKLCYIKCPYTEDEGAAELLDFPRLMAREKAQRARREGIPLVDRILGEPDLIGQASAGPSAQMANLVNANRLVRKVAEKTTGISAEFPLPPIASESFPTWLKRHEPSPEAGSGGEVVLFPTCYGSYNFPEVPRAAVRVLEHHGYRVLVPEGLACCGMPNLDGGDVARAREKMERNVALLAPLVARGLRVVVPGPTCGYTMKKEWPVYVPTEAARAVAAATMDAMQFLDELRKEKKLKTEFSRGLGKVAYHAACHLRAQKIAFPGARVLSRAPDTEVRVVERCSAVDGTWGMKAKFYEEGARYAKKLVEAVQDEPADMVVGDCNLAGLRLLKETGVTVRHPLVALCEAYGFSEFAGGSR